MGALTGSNHHIVTKERQMANADSTQLFGRAKDEAGNVYGKLTVICASGRDSAGIKWTCRCECGAMTIVRGSSLRNGHTTSCGCASKIADGKCHTPEYRIWYAIKHRCHNPKSTHYSYYGERGITVCERWRTSFDAFLADMGPKPFPKATVERTNNSLGYSKSNCTWATRKEQSLNTRSTKMLTYNGETLCQSDWARRLGIAYQTLCYRIRMGWPEDRVFAPKQHTHS
jgi:hypothetical protein